MDGNESISEVLDSGGESGEGRGRGSISAGGDAGVELLEESEGSRGDIEGALGVPDDERVVELFSDSESGEIPGLEKECVRERTQGESDICSRCLPGRSPRGNDR